MPGEVMDGRCLCGAVKFTISGEPLYNVICHCENCKRTSGSTFHTAGIFMKKQYKLISPPATPDDLTATTALPNITIYEDYATQSGEPLYRRFCAICGSKVSAMTPLNHDIISIPAGIMSSAGKDWKPHKEQFKKDKAAWIGDLCGGSLIGSHLGPGGTSVGDLK